MIVAFSGWSDAGEAATGALTHLLENLDQSEDPQEAILIAEYDAEDFYDFQVNRPMISVDESMVRSINWPSTQVYGIHTPHLDHDYVLVLGVEPSMKWRTFSALLLDLAEDLEVDLVITLGAMLADAPHTRPISVSGSGGHPDIAVHQSQEWENEVSEMALEDTEVSEYVKALEESKDAAEFKDVSGDEIARELERFLRRQNES